MIDRPDLRTLPGFRDIQALPVLSVLDALVNSLEQSSAAVLRAAPGAGKTTCVPLALLGADCLAGKKILMLEPRRLAARNAAVRMAELLGEQVGETVGYRVRLETRVSKMTRIEVVTEGILTRLLQADPALEDYGLVIFDEFHERHLDADLGLALCLKVRQWFRNPEESACPLNLLVMSATLDNDRVAEILGGTGQPAPVVESEGRQFPVSLYYSAPWQVGTPIVPEVVACLRRVLEQHAGNVLVFLPGQAEIKKCQQALTEMDALKPEGDTVVAPLYGDLNLAEQRKAIQPCTDGKRKVVLATPIAESSLTIEGITVVIDSGLARVPQFDHNTGMTRLQTCRISKASSEQRAGRAGRMSPGHCYRLWSETQQSQLVPFAEPEITQADLAPLALQLMHWGVDEPSELSWLDQPPAGTYAQAMSLLQQLGAVEKDGGRDRITPHGQTMACFPAHPRLAHMLLISSGLGLQDSACALAALLSERDLLSREDADIGGSDISLRLAMLEADKDGRADTGGRRRTNTAVGRVLKYAQQFRATLRASNTSHAQSLCDETDFSPDQEPGLLLACAYPDRVARRRSTQAPDYQMANGRAVQLQSHDPLQKEEWLVCAHVSGQKGYSSDRVYLAASLDAHLFDQPPLQALVSEREVVAWDSVQQRLVAEQCRHTGSVTVSRKVMEKIDPAQKTEALLGFVRSQGLGILPWSDALNNWRARVALCRGLATRSGPQADWPDLSDEALLASLDQWLAPYLSEVRQLKDFSKLDLAAILKAMLPWPLPSKLDELAPVSMTVPSGSAIRIDYTQQPPVLAVRLQEMFGCDSSPAVAQGRVPLMCHLLSPAQRPLAVTQDLESFWRNAYPEVKKEMKGRYPKHYWPDDPRVAQATRHVKSRM